MVIRHIGGRSIVLLQSGCISPSTQRHTQDASESAARKKANGIARYARNIVNLHCGINLLPLWIRYATNEKPPAGHCRRFRRLNIKVVLRLLETKRPSNYLPAT